MYDSTPDRIVLYTANWCAHARSVEGFLKRNGITHDLVNVDRDDEARQKLIVINDGFASVPTLVFPDGTKLTEPSFREIREKLGLEQPAGIAGRIRTLLARSEQDD
jgi:mycoredoxin